MKSGYRSDAEAFGRVIREILSRSKPRIWKHLPVGSPEESRYVHWAATWAAHWAIKEYHHAETR